jgi:hypothetical protein
VTLLSSLDGKVVLSRFGTNGLDSTFGNGGRKNVDLGPTSGPAYSVAVGPDGKIVTLGLTTAIEAMGKDRNCKRYQVFQTHFELPSSLLPRQIVQI